MDCLNITRIILTLILGIFFCWWANKAIIRFQNQPTGVKTYQTNGDSSKGIIFPNLAICQFEFAANNPILKSCGHKASTFIQAVRNCLSNSSKISMMKRFQNSNFFLLQTLT